MVGAALALLGGIGVFTAVYFTARNLPSFASLKTSQNGQTIVVRASDGSQILSLGPSYGQWLTSQQIPQVMKNAMVSAEDRRFYDHFGIDPIGLVRAIADAVIHHHRVRATSTITQQLARNIFLNSNRTMTRKAREAILAMALEWKFTKAQILDLYLNKVYFGGGAYGIDAASRLYFSHSARHLTTAEAAIIAGLVKAPSHYAPTSDVKAAIARANVVLSQMHEYGYLSSDQLARVKVSAVNIHRDVGGSSVRYFTDWVLPRLDVLLPNDTSSEPIVVWTTLDPALQEAATEAIKNHVPKGAQGALVSLNNDGAVLAMVGGKNYVDSSYNRATMAMRQPGSSWKLFVYLTALEAGYTPSDMVVDGPVTVDGWSPQNDDHKFAGPMQLRMAFALSKNTVAAELGNEVGFANIAAMARRFGITTPISTYPSMVLGTNEVHLLEMTRAYAEISAGGQSLDPYGIIKVTTANGKELYSRKPDRVSQLVPQYVVAEMNDMLQTVVTSGTGTGANIGRPVAGKTGTSQDNKDGWFLGFSSGVTTGVWMGRDDNRHVPGLYGGTGPAHAFAQYMRVAVKNRPVEQFPTDAQPPAWQTEPGDQFDYSSKPGQYYYVDKNGNLVQAGNDNQSGAGGQQQSRQQNPLNPDTLPPGQTAPKAPPAASSNFLNQAIGGGNGPAGRAPNRNPNDPPGQ